MVKEMPAKFDKYWSNYSLILSCTAILDPHLKSKIVEYYYTKIYGSNKGYINKVLDTLKKLFCEYQK